MASLLLVLFGNPIMIASPREISLARKAYSILKVRVKESITYYTELVEAIDSPDLLARNIGPVLDVLSEMCRQNRFPDLAACVVNQATDEPGTRYKDHTPHWREEQDRCISFDWN